MARTPSIDEDEEDSKDEDGGGGGEEETKSKERKHSRTRKMSRKRSSISSEGLLSSELASQIIEFAISEMIEVNDIHVQVLIISPLSLTPFSLSLRSVTYIHRTFCLPFLFFVSIAEGERGGKAQLLCRCPQHF